MDDVRTDILDEMAYANKKPRIYERNVREYVNLHACPSQLTKIHSLTPDANMHPLSTAGLLTGEECQLSLRTTSL
jgi:hypothetical protein